MRNSSRSQQSRVTRVPVAARLLIATVATFTAVGAGAQSASATTAPAPEEGSFSPQSVTFVSLETGWVLGPVPCGTGGACLALLRTADGGRSWSSRPVPAALAASENRKLYGRPVLDAGPGAWLNVRFANLHDGWIFGGLPNGGPVLWSTHDGGATWQQQAPPDLYRGSPIFDLEAANGTVYFMAMNRAQTVTVESSPVGQDAWQADRTPALALPAGGAEPGGSIVLQGGNGWLVEGNDRGITGSAVLEGNGVWKSWTPPCENVGDSYTVPAASNPSDLVAVCVMGGYASPLPKDAPPGATLGSSWLYTSGNGGLSFHYGAELSGRGYFNEVLAAPTATTIVTTRGTSSQQLVASFDGGRQWDVVYRADFFYVGFTSQMQGVALAQQSPSTPGRTIMVMTFDGGHHWSVVRF